MNTPRTTHLMGLALCMAAASVSAQVFSGRLDDPANAALVASDLGAASFAEKIATANNVAVYDFTVALPGTVTIISTGFATGGIDPYFSLFAGSGGAATFLASNCDQAFSTGGDFSYATSLAAGVYRFAIGAFANLSFAENFGGGTLSEGFTGLGAPASIGDTSYRVVVTAAVPEPSQWALLLVGVVAVASRRALQPSSALRHRYSHECHGGKPLSGL